MSENMNEANIRLEADSKGFETNSEKTLNIIKDLVEKINSLTENMAKKQSDTLNKAQKDSQNKQSENNKKFLDKWVNDIQSYVNKAKGIFKGIEDIQKGKSLADASRGVSKIANQFGTYGKAVGAVMEGYAVISDFTGLWSDGLSDLMKKQLEIKATIEATKKQYQDINSEIERSIALGLKNLDSADEQLELMTKRFNAFVDAQRDYYSVPIDRLLAMSNEEITKNISEMEAKLYKAQSKGEKLEALEKRLEMAKLIIDYRSKQLEKEKEIQKTRQEALELLTKTGVNEMQYLKEKLNYLNSIKQSLLFQQMSLEEQKEIDDEIINTMLEMMIKGNSEIAYNIEKQNEELEKQKQLIEKQIDAYENKSSLNAREVEDLKKLKDELAEIEYKSNKITMAKYEALEYSNALELQEAKLKGHSEKTLEYKEKEFALIEKEIEYSKDKLNLDESDPKKYNELLLKRLKIIDDIKKIKEDEDKITETNNQNRLDEIENEFKRERDILNLKNDKDDFKDNEKLYYEMILDSLERELDWLKSISADELKILDIETQIYKIKQKQNEELDKSYQKEDKLLTQLFRKRQEMIKDIYSDGDSDKGIYSQIDLLEKQIIAYMTEKGSSPEEISKILSAFEKSKPQYHQGGFVDEDGTVHQGEFVINKKATDYIKNSNYDVLDLLNKNPEYLFSGNLQGLFDLINKKNLQYNSSDVSINFHNVVGVDGDVKFASGNNNLNNNAVNGLSKLISSEIKNVMIQTIDDYLIKRGVLNLKN